MTTNPFRSFIVYLVTMPVAAPEIREGGPHWSVDPTAGQWRTVGLHYVTTNETLVDLGTARVIAVRFNERILPGKVRDEYLLKAVKRLEQQTGQPASRKDYAQLRDQVEDSLLPKAFIRRTVIPVAFYTKDGKDYMLVFTSSQKRADDVCSLLRGAFGDKFKPWQIQPQQNLIDRMTALATDGEWIGASNFQPADAAVLKGGEADDKRTIRIKDKDLGDKDVQQSLSEGYKVHELRIDSTALFTLNHNMVFKAIELPGVNPVAGDFAGFATIAIQTYKRLLAELLELALGGMADRPSLAAATSGLIEEDFLPATKYDLDDV